MKILIIIFTLILSSIVFAQEKWQGVDEAVIEKIAIDKGRQVKEPLISLEGDIELFVFALFSAIGGFVAGYYWRELVNKKGTIMKDNSKVNSIR